MSSHSEQPSSFIKFFDALFQEQNIKWLLGLGTLILLSSSTMLVSSHWDSYTPLWKYAVLIGYTAFFHAAGQIGYHQLALRKTGTGLMALTVLLIPISFAAFRWIHPASVLSIDGLLAQSGLLLLLLFNSVFAYLAANRIFHHFLLGSQPTFLASYLILAGFAVIVPALPPVLAGLISVIAWGVFAVGSIKVNRHAFWLAEEYRKPRVFGFFPIILLGTQFLTLFATSLAANVSLSWIGLGIVMTSLPILLAADSLARVIQVRSTLDSPPFTASVILAMVAGVAMVVGGVFLSAHGFPQTFALVPTALVAAVVMGLLARRTEKKGFVWMMILFSVAVYQTSPVFFAEILSRLAAQGASAIGEERLPFAFYGLTYLPLLGITSIVGQSLARRRNQQFAIPLKQFSIALTIGLAPIAFGHEKALFPVSLTLGGLLTAQTFLFRDRRLQFASLLVFIFASMGAIPFFRSALSVHPNESTYLFAWLFTAVLLQFPGMLFDRFTQRLPALSKFWNIQNVFQSASLLLTVCCTFAWTLMAIGGLVGSFPGAICLALLIVHAFSFRNNFVSGITLTVPIVVSLTFTANLGWTVESQTFAATAMICGLAAAGLIFNRKPNSLITQVFGTASAMVSAIGIIGLQAVFVPTLIIATVGGGDFTMWGAAAISLVAAIELSWRLKSKALVVLNWISLLAFSGCLLMEIAVADVYLTWIPCLWATLATVVAAVRSYLQQPRDERLPHVCSITLDWCLTLTLGAIAIIGLPFFSGALRLAGLVAIAGAFLLNRRRSISWLTDALLVVVNCHALVLVIQMFSFDATQLFALNQQDFLATVIPLAFASTISSILWRLKRKAVPEIAKTVATGLEIIAGLCLCQQFFHSQSELSFLESIVSGMAFSVLIVSQSIQALHTAAVIETSVEDSHVRSHAEAHVWASLIITFAMMIYFVRFDVIAFGSTFALFAPLMIALVTWGLTQIKPKAVTWNVFARPFRRVSYTLPALTVFVGIGQFLFGAQTYWPGVKSLALLLAGGFYFWRGIEEKRTGFLLGSAATLNISLAMLWNDLNWSDPQLFLVPVGITVLAIVELLREQIPQRIHNPLRYAAALSILVSPTFEIVGGSWVHLLTLMVTSVVIVIVAMGLRVRALMYTGTAFLIADLIAIVVRGSIDQPSLLWLAGIVIGAAVIGLAAYCERNREKMLQRLRLLSAELETWN